MVELFVYFVMVVVAVVNDVVLLVVERVLLWLIGVGVVAVDI